MPRIRDLTLLLNNFCNFACSYCSFRATDSMRFVECAPTHLKKAIDLFYDGLADEAEGGEAVLCFNADGEACLSRDLLLFGLEHAELLRRAHGPHAPLHVLVTNGSLLDDDLARALACLHAAVTISLDGAEDAHDAQRRLTEGGATHYRVLRGLRALRQQRIPFQVRAVVGPRVVEQIANTVTYLQDVGAAGPIKIRPMRLANGSFPTGSYLRQYTDHYIRALRQLADAGYPLEDLPDDAAHVVRAMMTGQIRDRYCAVGHSMLWMGPTGDIRPCGLLDADEYVLGHVDDVASWNDFAALLDHPAARSLARLSPFPSEPCVSCRWYGTCRGGCPALVMLAKPRAERPPLCGFYRAVGAEVETLVNTRAEENSDDMQT